MRTQCSVGRACVVSYSATLNVCSESETNTEPIHESSRVYDSANLAPSVPIIAAHFFYLFSSILLSCSLYTIVLIVEISSEISNSIDISSASEADLVGQRGQAQASEEPTQRNRRNHTNSTFYPTCVVAPSNKTKYSAGHKLVPSELATLSKEYGGQATPGAESGACGL